MNLQRPDSVPVETTQGLLGLNSRQMSLLMIVASMAIATAKLADAPVLRSANDRSRWCTVWSIVERNTYQIDEIRKHPGWDTIDIVRHNDHFYSSKPPLFPRMVAEIYRVLKWITGWNLLDHTADMTRLILFLINIVPMGIALWVFSNFIQRYSYDDWNHLFITACACFAVMYLPFLATFNNHTVAISCFMIAIPLAVRQILEEEESSFSNFLCGALAALGVCNELPAALLGIALFSMLLHANPRRTMVDFVPGAAVVLIAFFVTNYQATESWKPFYATYGTSTYVYEHEGVPSYWSDPKGIDRPRDSTATYLLHCTIGHHGILSLSPIFLITLLSWAFPPFYWQSRLRNFHLLGIFLTVATLGFYLTKTANYNYGGMTVSLRWMMWLIPFWLMSMLPALGFLTRRRWFRGIALVLMAISTFSAWYPSQSPWAKNWIYQLMEQAKWIDYSDPRPTFARTHYSWIGALPEGELQSDYSITFLGLRPDGSREKLRLDDGGPVEGSQRLILVSRVSDLAPETKTTGYLLNTLAFRAGKPVEEFLIGRKDGEELTAEDYTFFRGVPRRMQYFASRIRYEKTDLRTDAFRCMVGYTNVLLKGEEGAERRVIRDVWYSEEVPFGVLKWETRLQIPGASASMASRQLWTPVEVGKFLPREAKPPF